MQPFMTQAMLDGMDHFWRMRSYTDLQALPEAQRAKVLPYIRAWAESAAGMTGPQVFQASQQFHTTRVATVKACSGFDYVLSPVAPMPAFAAELPSPTNDPLRPLEHIGFTVPYNMSEQPAASVNCGYTASGLPIGLQISGRLFDDLGVLRLSRELGVKRTEAKQYLDVYFERYAGIRTWHAKALELAQESGEVRTLLGRRRRLHDIASQNGGARRGGAIGVYQRWACFGSCSPSSASPCSVPSGPLATNRSLTTDSLYPSTPSGATNPTIFIPAALTSPSRLSSRIARPLTSAEL